MNYEILPYVVVIVIAAIAIRVWLWKRRGYGAFGSSTKGRESNQQVQALG